MKIINCSNIILYDKDYNFLLQKRTTNAYVMPGYWGFFGGGIGDNEDPLMTVIREAKEELSYNLQKPSLFIEQDIKLNNAYGHQRIYIEEFKGLKSDLCLKEGEAMGWFSINEVDKLKMKDHDRMVIKEAYKHIKKLLVN